MPQLLDEVNALAAENGASIFQVPPYFAYIAKAFSVLEGIGLGIDPNYSNPNPYPNPNPNPNPDPNPNPNPGIDPNYSIVKETLPYISTRIITDPSPRTGGALATFVYGEAKDDEVSSP